MEDEAWKKEVGHRLKHIEELLTNVRIEVATLKVKASVWGALAGLIPIIVYLSIQQTLK